MKKKLIGVGLAFSLLFGSVVYSSGSIQAAPVQEQPLAVQISDDRIEPKAFPVALAVAGGFAVSAAIVVAGVVTNAVGKTTPSDTTYTYDEVKEAFDY